MPMFRKKPVVIEAQQLSWGNWNSLCEFMAPVIETEEWKGAWESEHFSDTCGETAPFIEMEVPTLEGVMTASHGDWIIRGVNGEFYPCKPDIFEKTYEPVDD